jgi:hypothetical protein
VKDVAAARSLIGGDGERVLPNSWLPAHSCFWDVPASQAIDEDRFGPWAVITSGL